MIDLNALALLLSFYITSEVNSYGLITEHWMEGDVAIVRTKNPTYWKSVQIKPEKVTYLNSKNSDCSSTTTYYECLGSRLAKMNFSGHFSKSLKRNIPVKCFNSGKCSAFSFPNMESYNISYCSLQEITNDENEDDITQGMYINRVKNDRMFSLEPFFYSTIKDSIQRGNVQNNIYIVYFSY